MKHPSALREYDPSLQISLPQTVLQSKSHGGSLCTALRVVQLYALPRATALHGVRGTALRGVKLYALPRTLHSAFKRIFDLHRQS
jgi:hypothetical protein